MSRAARQWRVQIDRAVKDSGLTECTLRPLLYLERMGDGVRQRDLANAMWVDASVMVRLVDVLEAAGHVSRLTEDRDRRFNKLFLTQSGRELLAKVRGKTDAIHRNLLSRSSPAERAACLRLFAALERMSVVAPST